MKNKVKLLSLFAGVMIAASPFVNSQPEFPMQVIQCNVLQVKGKEYLPYEGVNPFYVRFDGYGNGSSIYAILVKEPVQGKVVLLIVSPKDCKKWVIQEKTTLIGAEDFSWCHEINVFSKKDVNEILSYNKNKNIKACGEGVMLSPGETEGLVVYWNGTSWALAATDAGL